VKPKEFWAFKVNRLVKVDAAKPKPKAKPQNSIFKLLRETILGYVKIYSKEIILPFIEEIYQEAKNKKVEEYF
jgi:hypothetical protein